MNRGVAPDRAPGEKLLSVDATAVAPPRTAEAAPGIRTPELIGDELRAVRDQLDESLANGDLRLAAECTVELEQLRIEFAVLQLTAS